ncbi:SDA1 [Popillia japonica]|uniref:Protein SDA1 n=1 Tax=Popillia japonica TaxID=7064 RepID=A0AAW1LBG2_POPJA
MMAARSLIHLFRTTRPELLYKKDRGRPTEAAEELTSMNYGRIEAIDYIPGAEVLLKEKHEEVVINSDSDSNEDEWVDIEHSSDEAGNNTSDDDNDGSDTERKADAAKEISLGRILTDEDFKRIDMANNKNQLPDRGVKGKLKETQAESKRKYDKAARIASVKEGQKDRQKFGYKDGRLNIHCSKTNRERRKKKNFQMIKHKVKSKVKRSFKDKQIALRNHLIHLKKMK